MKKLETSLNKAQADYAHWTTENSGTVAGEARDNFPLNW